MVGTPVAFICLVEFAAAVGTFLDSNAGILHMTVFLTLKGIRISFLMVTRWSSTQMQPVSGRLAASVLVHATLRVAVV